MYTNLQGMIGYPKSLHPNFFFSIIKKKNLHFRKYLLKKKVYSSICFLIQPKEDRRKKN